MACIFGRMRLKRPLFWRETRSVEVVNQVLTLFLLYSCKKVSLIGLKKNIHDWWGMTENLFNVQNFRKITDSKPKRFFRFEHFTTMIHWSVSTERQYFQVRWNQCVNVLPEVFERFCISFKPFSFCIFKTFKDFLLFCRNTSDICLAVLMDVPANVFLFHVFLMVPFLAQFSSYNCMPFQVILPKIFYGERLLIFNMLLDNCNDSMKDVAK